MMSDPMDAAPAPIDESPSAAYLSCPECNTTKVMVPNLQLKFSTCCGRCMCIHCVDNRFKSVKIWNCTLCNEPLKKTSWDSLPIEEQRFKTEVQNRQETNRIFTLEPIDFNSLKEYNDYLETNADIVFSMTYGTRAEIAAARTRLADFQKNNRAAIDKSKSRKFQERADAERKERQAAGQQVQTMNIGFNIPSFVLPQPDATGAPPSSYEDEKRFRLIPDLRERNKLLWDLEEKRRLAGGFRREEDKRRSKLEAIEALWM